MIAKRRAREIALQMLYQQELGGRPIEEVAEAFDPSAIVLSDDDDEEDPEIEGQIVARETVPADRPLSARQEEKALAYGRRLAGGTLENRDELDRLIREQAENWRLERMPVIDRNILRLALFEMFHVEGVPKIVILDEAIELAKKYGSKQSSRFVNGLLDGVLKRTAAGAESAG